MATGMDYSLVQRIIDGLGKILDTKPGSPDEGTYVTEQQLADWIKGQTVVPAYYYNGVMYSDALHTTPITGQAGALYIDQDNNVLYRWDGAAWDAMSDNQLRQDILDGTVVAKKAECDEDGNNIKATYATKAEAAALQSQVDVLDHRVQNLEQAHGSYVVQNYKDGSITPSGKGNWAVVEGLRGVSRVENNLCPWKTLNFTAKGLTITSNNDGVINISGTTTNEGAFDIMTNIGSTYSGHGYLVGLSLKVNSGSSPSGTTFGFRYGDYLGSGFYFGDYFASASQTVLNNQDFMMNVYATGVSVNVTITPIITDMCVYFGTSDLSFLGATDSAKLATIQTNYPHLLTPSEYGVRIVDSSYVGVEASVPYDAWDGVLEEGYINVANGQNASGSAYMRCASYIPVTPNTKYRMRFPAYGGVLMLYGSDKSYLGYDGSVFPNTVTSADFVTGDNVYYIRFWFNHPTGTPFYAYVSDYNTLSLTFQGKSAGSVYDSCEPNVEVGGVARKRTTQRIDSVDLGTLDYERTATDTADHYRYYADIPTMKIGSYGNVGLLCSRYPIISSTYGASSTGISPHGSLARIFIHIAGMDTLSKEDFKTAMDGVILYYELATPVVTLSDPLIDNTLLTEAGGRMATVQTGTVVDGSFDLGFINL